MKYSQMIGVIILFIISVSAFKLIQKYTRVPVKENYNDFSCGKTCFNGKLSVPLPGRSKCFDCEREMIIVVAVYSQEQEVIRHVRLIQIDKGLYVWNSI